MFAPTRTASTAPAPAGAVSGNSTSTAGRLLITLASTAASAATASRAGSDVPPVIRCSQETAAEPVAGDRAHHDAQGQHEGEEGHVRGTGDRGRGGCGAGPGRGRRAASAPAQAAKAGLMPAVEATTKPASVHATVTSANSGVRGGSAVVGAALRRPGRWRRSGARRRYSTAMAASQSTAVRAAKRVKLTPLAANASRLVRLETGNSREDRSNSPVDAGPRQSLETAGAAPAPGREAREPRWRGGSGREAVLPGVVAGRRQPGQERDGRPDGLPGRAVPGSAGSGSSPTPWPAGRGRPPGQAPGTTSVPLPAGRRRPGPGAAGRKSAGSGWSPIQFRANRSPPSLPSAARRAAGSRAARTRS